MYNFFIHTPLLIKYITSQHNNDTVTSATATGSNNTNTSSTSAITIDSTTSNNRHINMSTASTNTLDVAANHTQLCEDIPSLSAPRSYPSTLTLTLNRVNATAASTTTVASEDNDGDSDDRNCENSPSVSIDTRLNVFPYIYV